MTRNVVTLTFAAAALLLAGCGSSDDSGDDAAASSTRSAASSTTTSAAGEAAADDALCVPLKVISDMDAETGQAIQGGWPATQEFFAAKTPEVLAAYDDAIALDTELTADLEALRDFTEESGAVAAESGSFEEFSSKLLATPNVESAGQAGLRLNTFAEETCGFSTTTNGG